MPDVIRRDAYEAGELTALRLRQLLSGVPDDAVVEISAADTSDPRNSGEARWWFKTRWNA